MEWLFSFEWLDFMPRAMCLRYNPLLISGALFFNLVIGICYWIIPIRAALALRRQEQVANAVAKDFAKFIFWCGTHHFGNVLVMLFGFIYLPEVLLVLPVMTFYSVRAVQRFGEILPALTSAGVRLATSVAAMDKELRKVENPELRAAFEAMQEDIASTQVRLGERRG